LNLDYATVFSLAPYMNENVVTIVGICLLIGAMAKSSQVGRMKALKKPR
jgi:NADH-ubiquinone oxidoreductase chain 5